MSGNGLRDGGEGLAEDLGDGEAEREAVEVGGGDPEDFADVAAGGGFVSTGEAGERAAEEVDEDVVVLGAAVGVGEDAVEDVEDGADFDVEAGFFQGFAGGAVAELFAEFEDSSGDGPFALERLGVAADEQDAVAVEDDGSYANDGVVRVGAVHGCSLQKWIVDSAAG